MQIVVLICLRSFSRIELILGCLVRFSRIPAYFEIMGAGAREFTKSLPHDPVGVLNHASRFSRSPPYENTDDGGCGH